MTSSIVQEQSDLKPSEEELKAYAVLANKSFKEKLALTQKAVETNPKFAAMVKSPIKPENMSRTKFSDVRLSMHSVLLYTWIRTEAPLYFPDIAVQFEADVWGFGVGTGYIWLAGSIDADLGASILGCVDFVLNTTPALTELVFLRGGTPFGILVGGGINLQFGTFGGTGTFSKWDGNKCLSSL